jgi:hypothetical protein
LQNEVKAALLHKLGHVSGDEHPGDFVEFEKIRRKRAVEHVVQPVDVLGVTIFNAISEVCCHLQHKVRGLIP